MEENDLKCEPVVASVDVPADVAVGDMEAVAAEDACDVGGNREDEEVENLMDRKEVERMLAEAEERAFLRGRNEGIAMALRSVGGGVPTGRVTRGDDVEQLAILRRVRRSAWERGRGND